ncbi:midasin-like [Ruditapes philippinarum]|uniref:midasin-like n=1 Tax=Ruditapes philippinarum TaxID=129788 RepID=UPI00295C239A|nr:midasin-like [Ruditapes philippinarum]
MQYSEVISAKASDNGNCYLKIVADYGNEHKESYHTVKRYMTEDSDEEKRNTVISVAVILVDFALILTAAAYLICLHHKKISMNICIWRQFITYDKGNSDSGRFSQTKNETYKQSQRKSCQKNEEQSKEFNSKNEDSQRYNDLRKEGLTQRLSGYDGTEDLTISAPDLNLDFPKHNEEEVSTEANDMSVKEPKINGLSTGRAVPGVGDEKDLSSKTIIDINPDRDVVENDENQQQYLDDGTLVNDERNDLSAEELTVNDHDQDVSEIEEVKNLLCKEQTIIDLYPDRDELGNYEKQKHQLAKHHKLDDQILENDERNELSANECTGNDHFLGKEVSEIEKELLSKKQTIIDLYTDRDNLESDEIQKCMLDKRQYLDDDMFENDEENGICAKDPTVNGHILDQDVPEIKEEKKLSSEKETVIHGDLGVLENDEKQKYLPAKQHGLDDYLVENEKTNMLSKKQTIIDRDENEEYHSAEEYDFIYLDNQDEHVVM